MDSIFLNFTSRKRHILKNQYKRDENVTGTIITGLHDHNTYVKLFNDFLNDVVAALIVHKNIVMPIHSFYTLGTIFSVDDLELLVRNKLITVVNDQGFEIIMFKYNERATTLSKSYRYQSKGNIITNLSRIHRFKQMSSNELYKFHNNTINHAIHIDGDTLTNEIYNEVNKDIRAKDIEVTINHTTFTQTLANHNLAYGKLLEIENIQIDEYCSSLISHKLNINQHLSELNDIIKIKKIPKFVDRKFTPLLSCESILELKEDKNIRKFEKYFLDHEYLCNELINDISLKDNKAKIQNITEFISWCALSFGLGLVHPILGIIPPFAEKFVTIPPIIKEWNPNIFFDTLEQKVIDTKNT